MSPCGISCFMNLLPFPFSRILRQKKYWAAALFNISVYFVRPITYINKAGYSSVLIRDTWCSLYLYRCSGWCGASAFGVPYPVSFRVRNKNYFEVHIDLRRISLSSIQRLLNSVPHMLVNDIRSRLAITWYKCACISMVKCAFMKCPR